MCHAARVYMWTSHRIELEKSDVQLFCRADGDPTPTITWLDRNGVAVKNDSKQYEVVSLTLFQHVYKIYRLVQLTSVNVT